MCFLLPSRRLLQLKSKVQPTGNLNLPQISAISASFPGLGALAVENGRLIRKLAAQAQLSFNPDRNRVVYYE